MPENKAKPQLVDLAKRLRKANDKLRTKRGDTKLNAEQKALCKESDALQGKIEKHANLLRDYIGQLESHIGKMGKGGCLRDGRTTANKRVKLKSYPGDEHVSEAMEEFNRIAAIEPTRNIIAKDVGVSRQSVSVMYGRGYATPQFAERLSRLDKYKSLDKFKLRPDLKAEEWDQLLVE